MNISLSSMRITGIDKTYYMNQLQVFAESFSDVEYKSICFGKQDIRGGISITFFNHEHSVPQQKHFKSKDAMLGFVCGYNATRDSINLI